MSVVALRQKILFEGVLDGGSGVRKEQKPSALGAQKITLSMAINERRQDPPQKKNPNEREDLCRSRLQCASLSFSAQQRLKEFWHGEALKEAATVGNAIRTNRVASVKQEGATLSVR